MPWRNKAFHMSGVGRSQDQEIIVTIPEPMFKKDPVLARVAIAGQSGQVVISTDGYALGQIAEFFADVAAEMRAMEEARREAA